MNRKCHKSGILVVGGERYILRCQIAKSGSFHRLQSRFVNPDEQLLSLGQKSQLACHPHGLCTFLDPQFSIDIRSMSLDGV